ncbi:MAG: hypothetical protein RL754_776 [Bacteroidota bacterium]|jgi:hypothetical protein
METQKKPILTHEAMAKLKADLHRIPDVHPMDRNIGPARAKKSLFIVLASSAVGIAATIALVLSFWPTMPTDTVYDDVSLDDLYSLGYVEVDDLLSFVEPDSLSIGDFAVDGEVYFNLFEDPENYLLEL